MDFVQAVFVCPYGCVTASQKRKTFSTKLIMLNHLCSTHKLADDDFDIVFKRKTNRIPSPNIYVPQGEVFEDITYDENLSLATPVNRASNASSIVSSRGSSKVSSRASSRAPSPLGDKMEALTIVERSNDLAQVAVIERPAQKVVKTSKTNRRPKPIDEDDIEY